MAISVGGKVCISILDSLEPVLDLLVVDTQNIFACGDFGLDEYIIDASGNVKEKYRVIENQVNIDVKQDFKNRIIFTNPDEGGIYLISGEDVVMVQQLTICKLNNKSLSEIE